MAQVLMPRLGVSVTEGTVSIWLKQVGETVELGEPICEVATDKVDTEIESTVAGVLTAQLYAEGEVVLVGEPLATVGSAEEAVAAPVASPETTPPVALAEVPSQPQPSEPGASAADAGAGSVLMPRLGVSVTEGTVSAWLKQVGETVEVGESICEVATDKVDTEIESTVAGVLAEQLYAEGEVVLVGEPLARVTADGTVPSGAAEPTLPSAPGQPPGVVPSPAATPAPAVAQAHVPGRPAELRPHRFDHQEAVQQLLAGIARSGRPPASPAARRLAGQLGVDLSSLSGTGGAGHVTRQDVERRAAEPAVTPPAVRPVEPAAPVRATPQVATPGALPVGYEDVPYEEVPTSRVRRVTAEHMSRSRHTAAHMTTEVDVDLGLLTDVRAGLNRQRREVGGSKLSFLPFIARATCAALLDHRDLNATFETERLLRWGEINLGIAVDTPRGLMVPVVRGAQRLTVESLGESFVQTAERVREGRIESDDFRAGTFTISNPGSVGAVSAPAIINQPQVAILGMPTIVRRPWVVTLPDGQETIAIRPILRLALTFDHRAVDGADATRCLVDIRRRLEAWGVDDYR